MSPALSVLAWLYLGAGLGIAAAVATLLLLFGPDARRSFTEGISRTHVGNVPTWFAAVILFWPSYVRHMVRSLRR